MKKVFFVIIVVLLLIVLGAALYLYFLQKKPSAAQPTPAQRTTSQANSNADKITIHTSQGDVAINNIQKNPVQSVPYDGSVLFRQTDDYDMYYYPPDSGFVITLMNPDVEKARTEAENDFVETLGVTKDQACLLKVTLNVPFNVNEKVSGENYGLSFCPNGRPFSEN